MVNFLCHLGWTMVPKYLVRHHSGCFCEGVFEWDWRLTEWTSGRADCLPYCEGASPNQLKTWTEQKIAPLLPSPSAPAKRNSTCKWPVGLCCSVSSSAACWSTLQSWDLPTSMVMWASSLKFLSTHTLTQTHRHGHMDTYTQTHTWTHRHIDTHRHI